MKEIRETVAEVRGLVSLFEKWIMRLPFPVQLALLLILLGVFFSLLSRGL